MFSFVCTKKEFMEEFTKGHIVSALERNVSHAYRDIISEESGRVNDSEKASWRATIPYMYVILSNQAFSDTTEIALEYIIEVPNCNNNARRIDVMLFGQGEDGLKHAVFIEMKQYSNLICCDDGNREGQEYVFTYIFNNRSYNCPNPSKQVTQYKDIVGSYNSAIQNGDIIVDKMVYLHNLDKSILGQDVIDELENSYTNVKVFYEGEIESVIQYLSQKVGGDSNHIVKDFIKGEPISTYNLYQRIDAFFSNESVQLRMDQARCFEDVLSKTLSHLEGRENGLLKLLVEGNPGSGKSILALKLLNELMHHNYDVKYVIQGGAMKSMFDRINEDTIREKFVYPKNVKNGSIPRVIIVDELQRVAKEDFSNLIEMLEANPCATVLVAFNGLGQRFRRSDVEAFEYDFDQKYRLDSQFRCGGDEGYIVWLDKVLFNRPSRYDRNHIYFDFEIVDTVEELFRYVADSSYVILAGPMNGRNSIELGGRQLQVMIPSFEEYRCEEDGGGRRTENNLIERHFSEGINYYGNINNIHGLEVENAVVIIRDELCIRERNNIPKLVCSDAVYDDQSVRKSYLGMSLVADYRDRELDVSEKELLDSYIKNLYKVLLTRGLKSCRVYCTNEEVREYLANN